MKLILAIILLVFVLFQAPFNISLADNSNSESKVNHVANVVEKLQEKLNLFLNFQKRTKPIIKNILDSSSTSI